jgi:hypothetical protein
MTEERIALNELLDKASDAELLAEMLSFVANRLMHLHVETLCKAGPYERSDERAIDEVGSEIAPNSVLSLPFENGPRFFQASQILRKTHSSVICIGRASPGPLSRTRPGIRGSCWTWTISCAAPCSLRYHRIPYPSYTGRRSSRTPTQNSATRFRTCSPSRLPIPATPSRDA